MSGSIFQAATEVSVNERDGTVTVYFLRSGDLSTPAIVTYDVTTESATQGADFTGGSGTVTFQAGQGRVGVTFNVLDDALSEATEAFVVSLVSINGGSLSLPRTCRVSILDDENPALPPSDPPLVSNYNVVAQTLYSGLSQPISIAFSQANPTLAYVAEKSGLIRMFDVQTGQDRGVFLDLTSVVCNNEDRGLMDIVLHPDFASNGLFYAYYVVDPPGIPQQDFYGNRYSHLVRFTADAATGFTSIVPGSGVVIAGNAGSTTFDINGGGVTLFDTPDTANQLSSERFIPANDPTPAAVVGGIKQNYIKIDSVTHAGGALAFGPDGKLYVAIGDGTSPTYADPKTADVQNLNSLSGKVLRIDPITGQGLADNPFYTSGQSLDANVNKIWQLGLRNPFSMAFDNFGRLYITDTGWNAYEEINSGPAGANFGWPWYEGRDSGLLAQTSGYRDFAAAQTFYQNVANGTIQVSAPYAAFGHDTAAPGFQNQVITGGSVVYDGSRYPAELTDDYFFTNFAFGHVFTVDTADRTQLNYLYTSTSEFAPVNFAQGPDGYVYYVDLGSRTGNFSDGAFGRLLISPATGQLVTLSAPAQVTEGLNGSATVTFTLSLAQSAPVTITYSTLNGTAAPDTDFTGVSNATVVIPTGQTTVQVAIPIVNDAANEQTEAFAVTINGATRDGTPVAASGSREIVILDNDGPPPNLLSNGSFEQPTVAAGAFGSFTSIPSWTAISGGTIELWNALNGVTAPAGVNFAELDFDVARDGLFQDVQTQAGQSYTLTFDLRGRPGQALSTMGIEVVWNGAVVTTVTPASTTAWASNSANVTGTGALDRLTIREVQSQGADGLGALIDNFRLIAAGPPTPSVAISASPAQVGEGASAATVTFTLSAAQTSPVIVSYSTSNGSALAGSDFTGATNVTATIPAGQTSVTAPIAITDDQLAELTETFSVVLNGATLNGSPLTASGVVGFSIIDNEPPPPTVTISAVPASVTEGQSASANIVFTLNAAQSSPVVVTYSTANGTATAGADFTGATNATATVAAGQTSVSVPIPIIDNATNEPTESFSVTLNGATLNGAAIAASGSTTVTVVDNDGPPPNILVNGSLEQPPVNTAGFANFASIPGWTAISGGQIELWNSLNNITATDGLNIAELDFDSARDGFYQDVTTAAGQVYALTFDLRGRPGFALSTQGIEVLWNGTVIATPTPASTTAWGAFTINVTGAGGADRLTIREVQSQSSDGLGALLDNFRLVANGPPAPAVTVSASPATVAEGVASADIVFTLNAAQAAPVIVTYSTGNGTATSGSDFTGATNATATIAAGQTSVAVPIPILNDIIPEPTESFTVTLNGATLNGAAIAAAGSATVTITDADPPLPQVSISSAPGPVTEGVGAQAAVTFTLSTVQATPVVVTYSTVNGTATSSSDFTGATNATATIAAGQTSVSVTMPLTNDNVFEPQETFSVALNGATMDGVALPATGSTTITIADDDPAPPSVTIAAQPATVTEGAGALATVVFTLNAVRASPVTVTYSTANGSATAGADYTGVTGATVDIPAGQTSVSVLVDLVNDNTNEPNETFSVTLDGATLDGAPIAATGSATITIADDDPPPASVSVAAAPAAVTEGTNPSTTITFTLNAVQAAATIVTYSTVNGTATGGVDFASATMATATIPAGQLSVPVTLAILNDLTNEPTESFTVSLDGATVNGAAIAASGSATVTITDNDPVPAVSVSAQPSSVTEGTSASANIVFTLNAPQDAPVVVTYSTVNGTATASGDFTGASNATATIAAGQTSVAVPVSITDDLISESSESFSVALNGATLNGAAIAATGSATVTILDNDGPPPNLLTNASLEQPTRPPNSFGAFSSIPGWTAITGGAIELWNALNGVTATNGANFAELDSAGARDGFFQDVTTVAGQVYTLTFDLRGRAGVTLATQGLEVLWNGAVVATTAPTSTAWSAFSVNVTGTGAADRLTIREVQSQSSDGSGALLDNFRLVAAGPPAPAVTVSATPATVTEGTNPTANVTFTLNTAQSAPVIVTYSTVNGTATAAGDFTGATNATATIAAGETSVTVQVAITDDLAFEPTESFAVALNGATLNGATIAASGSATITIADNDPAPPTVTVSASPANVTEGPTASANIVFTLNTAQGAPVTVNYSTANGSALAGSDFTGATNAMATIAAGQTSVSVSVPLIDDTTGEPTETFSVTLNGATLNGSAIAASGSTTVTILDNDGPPPNLLVNGSLESPTVAPGNFSALSSIQGWTAISGGTIERWNALNGVTATNGVNFAELDYAGARDGFFQDVQTASGQTYTLTFDLRGRSGFALSTQGIEVVWNGALITTATPTSTTAWGTFSVAVTGTGGLDRLTIREVQSQSADGLGALLDNFRLVADAVVQSLAFTEASFAPAGAEDGSIEAVFFAFDDEASFTSETDGDPVADSLVAAPLGLAADQRPVLLCGDGLTGDLSWLSPPDKGSPSAYDYLLGV